MMTKLINIITKYKVLFVTGFGIIGTASGWYFGHVKEIENKAIIHYVKIEKEINNDSYLTYRKAKDLKDSVQFIQIISELHTTNELLNKVVNNENAMISNWKQFLIDTEKANTNLYLKLTEGLTEIKALKYDDVKHNIIITPITK